MYKFEGTKYATSGITNCIDINIQIFLWQLIEEAKKETKLDYLQVFELEVLKSGVLAITHRQEVPRWGRTYYRTDLSQEMLVNGKIYVIDEVSHCTMMWAEEY